MTWGFYGKLTLRVKAACSSLTGIDYSNYHGDNPIAKAMMVIVAVLNAGRNSFSFFLLLIVCMGYGVVKHTLGKTMTYVRILAVAHFVFGVLYAIASLTITPENAGLIVLLVVLPLAGTLTAFYIWTLNSLNLTMKDLLERKQNVKAMMYKKLWWCILASIIVIFGFFFLNSFTFAGRNDPDFVPDHWKTRWFILDGWLNLVYFVDITYIAYLWRPTANNRRFAMSDEVQMFPVHFHSNCTLLTKTIRLLKTTKGLKSPPSAALWMRKRVVPLALARPELAMAICPPYPLNLSMITRSRLGSLWTVRPFLRLGRMGTSGPTTMNLRGTRASGKN
jgi:hypothetical protein